MLVHPREGRLRVLDAKRAGGAVGGARAYRGAAEEPEDVEAVVDGDDLRENIRGLQTQQWGKEKPLDLANTELLAANVYMGSQPIVDALAQDPHIVVTGRVTDSALT